MDLVGQVYIFGLSNIHSYRSNISLIRLFSLIFNYAKPRLSSVFGINLNESCTLSGGLPLPGFSLAELFNIIYFYRYMQKHVNLLVFTCPSWFLSATNSYTNQ